MSRSALLLVFTLCGCLPDMPARQGSDPPPPSLPTFDGGPGWPADSAPDLTNTTVPHEEPPKPPVPYPGLHWPGGDPAQNGLDPAALDQAAAYAQSIGSHCLVVIRNGRLVYERYWGTTTPTSVQKSWSIAKSFTAALVGIAVTRGEIKSVDQKAADYIPQWKGTSRQNITIRQLLSMSSGLSFELASDNTWSILTYDQTAEALANTVAQPPDTVWNYSNHGVQVLHAVLKNATGVDPEIYAEKHLWGPIGMNLNGPKQSRTHWERDGAGNPTMYMSVHSSCRDLARFGYLFLHGGRWDDEQIIDAAYVKAAIAPSQPLNRSYGYLWWLNGFTPAISSEQIPLPGMMFDFAPHDLVSAQGLGQNFIDVIPSTNTVYVHMRKAPHDPLTQLITDLWGTLGKLLADGKQTEHRALLKKLLAAG